MKHAILVAVALVAGSLLGGWPHTSKIYQLQAEVTELEAQLAQRAFDGNPSLSGIARMLNVPEALPEEPPAAAPVSASEDPPAEDPAVVDASGGEPAPPDTPPSPPPPPDPEEMRRRIEEAARLWEIRAELARDGFLNAIGADEEQSLRFDVLMEAMNIRLAHAIENWAQVLHAGEMPVREAGVRMMNEISEALVITYDEMDRGMPPTWKQDAGPEFQLIDHIDPTVALPLSDVADRMEF